MSTPTPESKASQIEHRIDEIRVKLMKGHDISFMAAQVMREVIKLKKNDAFNAYIMEGMIDACLQKEKESRLAHEKAIKLNPNSSFAKLNYAVSLLHLNCWEDALSLIAESSLDLDSLNTLARYSLLLGKAKESLEYSAMLYSELKDRNMEPAEAEFCHEMARRVDSFLNEESISEKEVKLSCGQVSAVLKKHKKILNFPFAAAEIDDFYGDNVLHMIYQVAGTAEEISEMNSELCRAISDIDEVENWHKIIPQFRRDYIFSLLGETDADS